MDISVAVLAWQDAEVHATATVTSTVSCQPACGLYHHRYSLVIHRFSLLTAQDGYIRVFSKVLNQVIE